MAARGHRTVPHTADVILEAWGPDASSCCEEAVAALATVYVEPGDHPVAETHGLRLAPGRAEDLLLALLDEVIFVLDTSVNVPVAARVQVAAEEEGLEVELELAPPDAVEPTGAVPKAISRSGLLFDVTPSGARCAFLVDV